MRIKEQITAPAAQEPTAESIGCIFCGAAAKLVRLGDKAVCRNCIERLHNAKDGDMLYVVKVERAARLDNEKPTRV